MDFLKKLSSLFTAPTPGGSRTYWIAVECLRCHEVIRARINLFNDLSANFDSNGKTAEYICRKVLMGQQHCYQQIEVTLTFNARRKLIDQQIQGGKFVEEP
ncbi:MAG TPA: hypothetical protein VII92_20575 [Anaerolineae bacterium]